MYSDTICVAYSTFRLFTTLDRIFNLLGNLLAFVI